MPKKSLLSLTPQQQIKAIASVWGNENKLNIAKVIYKNSPASPIQIIDATGQISAAVSRTLREMLEVGVVEKADYKERNQVFYRLTELGKQVVTIGIE